MSETVPVFACKGDEIVEVAFVETDEVKPHQWELVTGTTFEIKKDIDRLVYETPIGCFEQSFSASGDEEIQLHIGEGPALQPCTRPPTHFVDAAEEVKARLV